MNKINLYWFQHKAGHGNFGDELNPYIIGKLSSAEINHLDAEYINDNKILIFKILFVHLFTKKISLSFFIKYCYLNFIKKPHLFVAIGSVLQFCKTNNVTVWGSGMLSSNSILPNARYIAVRGFETVDRIKELGFEAPEIVGDPAILLPLLYRSNVNKTFKLGIIPHYLHYEYYNDCFGKDTTVINLLDKIEDVIDQINQCELIVSTSLHGIITAHAYGVKSIWAVSNKKKLSGDDIKFADYFSSVNINNYSPLDIEKLIGLDATKIINQISESYDNVLIPDENILAKIQKDLLDVYPYK